MIKAWEISLGTRLGTASDKSLGDEPGKKVLQVIKAWEISLGDKPGR